jgi:hypothetical protein
MVGWVLWGSTAVGLRLAATVGTGERYAAFFWAAVRPMCLAAAAFRVAAGVPALVIAVFVRVVAAAVVGVVAAATVLVVGDATGVDVLLDPPQAASAAAARTAPARNANRLAPIRGGLGVELCGVNGGITSSASRAEHLTPAGDRQARRRSSDCQSLRRPSHKTFTNG